MASTSNPQTTLLNPQHTTQIQHQPTKNWEAQSLHMHQTTLTTPEQTNVH